MRLSPDYSFAESSKGERILFTRSERRVLAALAGNPNRLLTRDQILDAITGLGSDKSDRNIDFLINRLRRKLSDNARAPRYIATRYGEGYVWIGGTASAGADYADAYLIVGPLKGFDNLGDKRSPAERFASDLYGALKSELPLEQKVVLAPDCPPAGEFGNKKPSLSVELTFFEESGAVNCVALARDFRTGRILTIHRVMVPADGPGEAVRTASGLAQQLLDHIWRALAMQTDAGIPLPVLMHLASSQQEFELGSLNDSDQQLHKLNKLHENRNTVAWKENEARLRGLIKASPDDPVLMIMYATHIHSKYVFLGSALFQAGIDDRTRDEDDIETLVIAALPQIQSQPEYAIMAAKLLHFVDRCYFDLARELSERAYSSSVSAVSSLSIIGQLRAFSGDIEAALRCIDQALNLVTPGTKAHLYALTLKMQALLAAADFERLQQAKHELYTVSPVAMVFYEPMFANPDELSLRAKTVTMLLPRKKAVAFLMYQHYIGARLFRRVEHRNNSILPPLKLFVRRFGKASVPDEIAMTYQRLLDRFD